MCHTAGNSIYNPWSWRASGPGTPSGPQDIVAHAVPHDVHRLFVPFFNSKGFQVVRDGTFDMTSDRDMCNLTRDSIFAAAKRMVEHSGAEALFVSCTSVPVVDCIADLEDHLGLRVVTSTQAEAWHALRLLEIDTSRSATFGSLFGQRKMPSLDSEVQPFQNG
ncbi:hypothetical protein [Mesorhizobium sp.]|uniref:aspartate racemase/maleate isomerase family protein n=1 Tax=Mesorhizobium sp. TaxID=1871066 RepID=UPI00345DDF81